MFISETEIKVRYAETDQMGVVHHSNYLIWMEVGRTQFIKDLGLSYTGMEKQGILAPVVDVQISYKRPLTYDDTAIIQTWIETYNGLKVVYGYNVLTDEREVAVTGFTTHVCVKKDNFRPVSLRKLFPDWHQVYEKAKKSEQQKEEKD